MTRTWTLTGLIFIFLGTIWALQGVDVLDGEFFPGRTLSITAGVGTLAVGVAMVLWGNFRPRRR